MSTSAAILNRRHTIARQNGHISSLSVDLQSLVVAPAVPVGKRLYDQTVSTGPVDLTSKYAPFLQHSIVEPSAFHLWALTRPELCESLPYFQAYQGGVYVSAKSRMAGYLLDGYSAPGDIWADDGRFIVSHGGGSAAPGGEAPLRRSVPFCAIEYPRNIADLFTGYSALNVKPSSRCYLQRDQSSGDTGIEQLLKAKENNTPVALIVGRNYVWWPLAMDHAGLDLGQELPTSDDDGRSRYVVLGWYSIRDAWTELEPGFNGDENSNLKPPERVGDPWWISDLEQVHYGRMSLQRCAAPDISNTRLLPTPQPSEGLILPASGFQQACGQCKKISRRIYHEGWFCTNTACTLFCTFVNGELCTERTLSYSSDFIAGRGRPKTLPQKLPGHDHLVGTEITTWSMIPKYSSIAESYEREHWRGRCCLNCGRLNSKVEWIQWRCLSCKTVLEKAPNTIYTLPAILEAVAKQERKDAPHFDEAEVKLYREHKADDGGKVMSYLLCDGGTVFVLRPKSTISYDKMLVEYQEQALQRQMFRRAPLKRARVPGQHTSHFEHNGGVHYNFNCHVITEAFDIGPPVVTEARNLLESVVSDLLGRVVIFNEVLSCAYKNGQSMGYHSDDEKGVQATIAAMSLGSPAMMSFRRKPNKGTSSEKSCLDILLKHGDVLVMDGAGIQRNFQHRVTPYGLRFAATARLIK